MRMMSLTPELIVSINNVTTRASCLFVSSTDIPEHLTLSVKCNSHLKIWPTVLNLADFIMRARNSKALELKHFLVLHVI